ncbi:hypothetical protein [Neisseria sp.]
MGLPSPYLETGRLKSLGFGQPVPVPAGEDCFGLRNVSDGLNALLSP